MALDGITVAAITKELSDKLTGTRISRIIQPEPDALFLTFKGKGAGYRLLMSAGASLPLIYLTEKNRTAPLTAPNFCMLLRKHIGSGKVLRIFQPGLERIIHFEIEHYDELGDLRRKQLVLELMGKHSNLIFLDEENRIIDSIKHVSGTMSSVREVLPGRTYFVPEPVRKADPLSSNREEFEQTVFTKAMPLAKAIYTSYTGISPVEAEELIFRAGAESDQSANTIPENLRLHLWNLFQMEMEEVKAGNLTPLIVFDEKEQPVEFAARPLHMYEDLQIRPYESISSVLEEYYALKDTVIRIRQRSSDLRRITDTAIDRTSRKLDLQQRQMKDTEKMEKYRLYGELLHTYGYSAAPGARSLTVTNYYNGEEVTIPLDETLSAQENAGRYYEKYTKLKRTAQALSVLVKQTEEDLRQLLEIRTFLDMALLEEDLVQVKEELTEAGYIRRRYSAKKTKITSKPYHYQTADGYDLYVGKNNLQNDELTFHQAVGGDWWFHAKKVPGSHVIAKVPRGEELPDHVFEDAARLAAYYSANRASGKAEIDYVQRKHVKKPAGAKPGFVVYYTNYSMVAGADISHLQLIN